MAVILVDFDGTCVKHAFPKLGEEIGAAPVLKKLVDAGHKLILFTMRCDHPENFAASSTDPDIHLYIGEYLTQAISWFEMHNISLYGVQTNPDQKTWTTSPKAYGNYMIDDIAIGCPLIYPLPGSEERAFVDWVKMEELLINLKLIK